MTGAHAAADAPYRGVGVYADAMLVTNFWPVTVGICEAYAHKFRVVLNAVKSAVLCCCNSRKTCLYDGLQFSIDGKCIATVDEYPHLGHIVSSNLDDKVTSCQSGMHCVVKLTMLYVILVNVIHL